MNKQTLFKNWWKEARWTHFDVEIESAESIFEAGRIAGIEQALGVGKGKPRSLQPMGSGGLLPEQQFCFNKGWKEGRAILRKAIRNLIGESNGKIT